MVVCAVPEGPAWTHDSGMSGVGEVLGHPLNNTCCVVDAVATSIVFDGDCFMTETSDWSFFVPSSTVTAALFVGLGGFWECSDWFACMIVGHSEATEVIAAKLPWTGVLEEVRVDTGSELATATVVVAIPEGVWMVVLGVFRACVTKNLALCTDLVEPLIVIVLSPVPLVSGLPMVIWAPDSSVIELILLPPLPITRPHNEFGATN